MILSYVGWTATYTRMFGVTPQSEAPVYTLPAADADYLAPLVDAVRDRLRAR